MCVVGGVQFSSFGCAWALHVAEKAIFFPLSHFSPFARDQQVFVGTSSSVRAVRLCWDLRHTSLMGATSSLISSSVEKWSVYHTVLH